MLLSLYLHFPFCKRKCSYCDFCSATASQAQIEAYCHALQQEIMLYAPLYAQYPVDTVFIGGGTPSIVPAVLLAKVLTTLREQFTILPDAEFTCESNPGTLTDVWLDVAARAGVNRLSIGVQAVQEPLLQLIGRIHDYAQVESSLRMARQHGITNLNADVMFGLPTQTVDEYLQTLDTLAGEGVSHISAYSLIVEEGTRLQAQVARGERTLPNEDVVADMLEQGIQRLKTLGYERYEISNFAKPNMACKHNLGYWQQKRYLGLGVSAASLLPAPVDQGEVQYMRQTNITSVPDYVRLLNEGKRPVAETIQVNAVDAMFETIMLGLRTVDGIRFEDFAKRHGQSLPMVYSQAIEKLTHQGLLQPIDNARPSLALTQRGLALQNTALMAFMNI